MPAALAPPTSRPSASASPTSTAASRSAGNVARSPITPRWHSIVTTAVGTGSSYDALMARLVVLASTSPYRAALMSELARPFETAAPAFDERAEEHRFAGLEPGEFAVELAVGKA